MPIALDPQSTADIDIGNGVRVCCRYLTIRQRQKWWSHLRAAYEACDVPPGETPEQRAARGERCASELRAALAVGVIGPAPGTLDPEGRPVPMTLDGLDDILTHAEVWTLAEEYPEKLGLSETEKKRSGSPAASAGAPSAAPAATASA